MRNLLLLFCVLLFTTRTSAQYEYNKIGNVFTNNCKLVSYCGVRIEINKNDSTIVPEIDSNGDKIGEVIMIQEKPTRLDGKPIYGYIDTNVEFKGNDSRLEYYTLKNMKTTLQALQDGFYGFSLNDIVIDTAGKICCYYYSDLFPTSGDSIDTKRKIDLNVQQIIGDQLRTMFEEYVFYMPALDKATSKKINVSLNVGFSFKIKDHVLYYQKGESSRYTRFY